MSSKLIPAKPSEVMVIRDVTPNVVTLSVPFARFGILRVGGRGTIVKMTSGKLLVFSPVALTPEVKAKVAELGGRVGYLVAPDIEHHIFLSEWAAEYPDAKILGPEGLPEKRAKQQDPKIGKVEFAKIFKASRAAAGGAKKPPESGNSNSVDEEFDADFAVEYMYAHPSKEIALFFRPDRVLLEADIMFNLPATEQYSRIPEADKKSYQLINKFWGGIQTTQGDLKTTRRFMWYVMSIGDRKGFNESIAKISAWDFTILIPCHGDVIEENAKGAFDNVFLWQLKGKQ